MKLRKNVRTSGSADLTDREIGTHQHTERQGSRLNDPSDIKS